MPLLRRMWALSSAERRLLLEAVLALLWARGLLLLLPFSSIARRMGALQAETPQENHPEQAAILAGVRWALNAVARRLPWQSSCLVRALAGQRMLLRRQMPATLYFGVRRVQGALQAHAWLRCGQTYVTGDDCLADFTPICSYASLVNKTSCSAFLA